MDALLYASQQAIASCSIQVRDNERMWVCNSDTLIRKIAEMVDFPTPLRQHENAHTDIMSSTKSLCLCTDQCFIKITPNPHAFVAYINEHIKEVLVDHDVSSCGHVQVLELCERDCFSLRKKSSDAELNAVAKFLINAMQVLFAADLMYTDIKLENVGITAAKKFCLLDLESIMPYTHPTQPCSATFVPDKTWVSFPHLQQRLPFYGAACTFVDLANASKPFDVVDPIQHKHKLEHFITYARKQCTGLDNIFFGIALIFLRMAHAKHCTPIDSCTEAMHHLYMRA